MAITDNIGGGWRCERRPSKLPPRTQAGTDFQLVRKSNDKLNSITGPELSVAGVGGGGGASGQPVAAGRGALSLGATT